MFSSPETNVKITNIHLSPTEQQETRWTTQRVYR